MKYSTEKEEKAIPSNWKFSRKKQERNRKKTGKKQERAFPCHITQHFQRNTLNFFPIPGKF
jgi:hypothetical protein